MTVLKPPRGLIIDLITPLKKNGAVDGSGLEKHLGRVLPHVQGVFIASPYLGEGRHLRPSQKEELLDKTLVVIRGRVPVMIWISGETEDETRETLLLLEKRLAARNYGGQIFWVDTPLFYHSNRDLFTHYQHLTSLTKAPFLLHNDPDLISQLGRSFKRNNIRTGILKKLAEIQAIQGLIFLGPLDRAYNYQKAVRFRADFRIYDGDENHFLRHPSLSGVVSAGVNLAPRAWSKVTESSLHLNETLENYPDALQQLWETGQYLRKLRDIYSPDSAPLIKQVLSDRSIIGSPLSLSKTGAMERRMGELNKCMHQYGDFPSNSPHLQ